MRLTWIFIISLSLGLLWGCDEEKQRETSPAESSATPAVDLPPVEPGYEIDITVEGYTGNKVYLASHFGSSNRIEDSVLKVNNGRFVFEGEERLPEGMYMVVMSPANTFFEVIIDRDQHFKLRTDTTDYARNMQIEGSPENEVFYDDILYLAAQRQKVDSLRPLMEAAKGSAARESAFKAQFAEIDSAVMRHRRSLAAEYPHQFYPKFLQAMDPPKIPDAPAGADENWQYHYYKKHFFDQVDLADSRLLRSPALYQKVDQYMEQLTPKHPDSVIASIDYILERAKEDEIVFQYLLPTLINKYGVETKLMGMDAVYVHMVEQYYLSGDAWWADSTTLAKMEERALALSPNLVGRPAPDFTAYDLSGQPRNLYGVKAPWTILYFWDYDCSHCKTVTPKLGALYPDYKKQGVALFAVSINGDLDEWKQTIEKYGLGPALNVQDHARRSGFDDLYDIRSTPRVFILDENKIIRYKSISVEQIPEVLDRELAE